MIVQLKRLRSRDAFLDRIAALGLDDVLTPTLESEVQTALTTADAIRGRQYSNRFAVLPMEGWDATTDGRPTELVERRWTRFGMSGAALIWGGEAVAVVPDGRANPHQLMIGAESEGDLSALRDLTLTAHHEATDGGPRPMIGLQLTHSGRWARPNDGFAPRLAYRHRYLDARVGATDRDVVTDIELDDLIGAFVRAAVVARNAGFDFVDIKHCHGYLLHEILTAYDRNGQYGGSLSNRTRFVTSVIAGIQSAAPEIDIGVRLSAFDLAPHVAGPNGVGVIDPAVEHDYAYAFGGDGTGRGVDLRETHAFCQILVEHDVHWLSVTAGSPYYCPHAQRPAYFPPSDGYLPPRDPLIEVAAMLRATGELAHAHPDLAVIASGMSYLQEWLPSIGAQLVRSGTAAFVGVGRSALSYPELPLHAASGAGLQRAQLCRTFSDCTTAPRNGLVSGCYPLDPFFKHRPERVALAAFKRAAVVDRGARRRNA